MAKKTTLWYSLGEAEKATGVPRTRLDHACRINRLQFRRSESGARLLSQDVIEKLRKDGLRAFPRPYDPPAAAAESAQSAPSNNPVETRRQHVEELKIQAEEVRAQRELDRLRAEDQYDTAQQGNEALARAMAEKRELERLKLEAAREAETRKQKACEEKAQRRHREWQRAWVEYAIKLVPKDAPRRLALAAQQAALDALTSLQPDESAQITEHLVHAAVENALQPWRYIKEIEKIIVEASDQLPVLAKSFFTPTEWQARATRAASEAIARLDSNTPLATVRAAAIEAGNRVRAEYEVWRAAEDHRQRCQQLVDSVFLVGATPEQARDALQAVKQALAKFPVGTSHTELQRAKDATLAPFQADARAARDADQYLAHVGDYIERLDRLENGPGHFAGCSERRRLAGEIAKEIRPVLIQRLTQEPLDPDEAYHLIEGLVDTRLDINQ
jgi:hypothetical protein